MMNKDITILNRDTKRNFDFIFLGIALGDLIGTLINSTLLDYIFKPLIMLSLMIYFYQETRNNLNLFNRLIISALFFSWGGDIFLMFEPPIFFQLGLGSFLISHLFYISAYWNSIRSSKMPLLLKHKPYLNLPYIALFLGLNYWLYPKLGDLIAPVLVYSLVLLSMSLFALNRYDRVTYQSFIWVYIGSLFFVFSDLYIAINKFVFADQLPFGGFIIMITYIIAQYLIVNGCLKQM